MSGGDGTPPIVLACGGRDFDDAEVVDKALSALGPFCVVQGRAKGADSLAGRWAIRNGVWCVDVPALWDEHGRGAGPRRNEQMLQIALALSRHYEVPLIGVAFKGGRGTADMVRRLTAEGVPVVQPAV